jgi:hypothetical protein
MNFKFEPFNIWQKAVVLGKQLNKRADVFSKKERDHLSFLQKIEAFTLYAIAEEKIRRQ